MLTGILLNHMQVKKNNPHFAALENGVFWLYGWDLSTKLTTRRKLPIFFFLEMTAFSNELGYYRKAIV